jgi:hypothetical protein
MLGEVRPIYSIECPHSSRRGRECIASVGTSSLKVHDSHNVPLTSTVKINLITREASKIH